MIKVSVIGANGYTGVELMNIFTRHPAVKTVSLVSQSNHGKAITELYPGLTAYDGIYYDKPDYEYIAANSDAVFTALPHAASAEAVCVLLNSGVKVIDLSADFRYEDVSVYESVYKVTHPAKHIKGVYGLPELFRQNIVNATLVANPGCYTTSAILPLYPLLKEKLINPDEIIINAASGVSGAGRKAEISYNYCEINENFKAYSVTNHRHTSEIEEKLGLAAGRKITLQFTPHLLPVQRGILSTIYLKPQGKYSAEEFKRVYDAYYGKEEFIKVRHDNSLPSINSVKYSNMAHIGYTYDARTDRVIVVSALDNLIKGAAGQAVQNMNIMFNLPENTGLKSAPYHI
ncbi:MAG: N-acetyl-gamma-glutamyl-phosphate reductase [Christensenellales bacterium]|jgi:N-acetyl-gamma-glutamyl-phosphate reductase